MKLTFLLIAGLCITVMLQAQVSKTLNVIAGGLSASLTVEEKTKVLYSLLQAPSMPAILKPCGMICRCFRG